MGSFSVWHWLILLAVVAVFVMSRLQYAMRKKKGFDWYRSKYPQLVRNGGVHCHKCEARDIRVHGLQGSSIREHLCGRCGTTLYYSEAGRA
jgi:uncharacterized paraquat-inducible protein A